MPFPLGWAPIGLSTIWPHSDCLNVSGQHFLSHEDAFPPDIAKTKGYQRRATLLVYLNDVAQGGQTKYELNLLIALLSYI